MITETKIMELIVEKMVEGIDDAEFINCVTAGFRLGKKVGQSVVEVTQRVVFSEINKKLEKYGINVDQNAVQHGEIKAAKEEWEPLLERAIEVVRQFLNSESVAVRRSASREFIKKFMSKEEFAHYCEVEEQNNNKIIENLNNMDASAILTETNLLKLVTKN